MLSAENGLGEPVVSIWLSVAAMMVPSPALALRLNSFHRQKTFTLSDIILTIRMMLDRRNEGERLPKTLRRRVALLSTFPSSADLKFVN
ncbi:hypothetical protein F5Y15DRAFT_374548 [Xylariaceae sp. FL0016]|nr:hypothetical protein F5Y15DRAFT_374548 [Xylariaceae sp. FL0016]